ncbi:MAG: hypothetical protein Q9200_001976 [Gallowayella weberi]
MGGSRLPASSPYFLAAPWARNLGQTLLVVLDQHDEPSTIRSLFTHPGIGSVVITCSDVPDLSQIANSTRQLQHFAKEAGHEQPLLISLKEEGGLYDYLPFGLGAAHFPYPLSLAAGNSPSITRQVGAAIGNELASIGVNWVFTPTLDLLSDVTEPLSASQTFGSDPTAATQHALALIEGLAAQGVSACSSAHPPLAVLEVFRAPEDTNLAEAVDEQSDMDDFQPIAAVIARYPNNSMQFGAAIHEFPDPVSSTANIRAACEQILRDKCGYQGPTVSALAETPEEASVCARHATLLTILSGLDISRLPNSPVAQRQTIAILKAAIASNVLKASDVSEAAARVAALKARILTWERALDPHRPQYSPPTAPNPLAQQTYRASTTALSPTPSPLLGLPRNPFLALLTPTVPRRHPNSPSDPFEPLGRALARFTFRMRHVPYTLSAGLTEHHDEFIQRATVVVLVLCNASSALMESQDEVVNDLRRRLRARDAIPDQQRTRKVVIAAGDPRDIRDNFEGWWAVCCYEYSRGALEAAAEVVLGERQATGRLPARFS